MTTVMLDGATLSLADVIDVARGGAQVALSPTARRRMAEGRAIAEQQSREGRAVYGLTTGVGALKRVSAPRDRMAAFNDLVVRASRTGQGPQADEAVVRATMLRLANALARGNTGVRPALGELVVDELNARRHPAVRTLGSVGQADLMPLADLAHEMLESTGFQLADGEGLALLSSNAFSTGIAALAVHDCTTLVDTLEVSGALSLEGFAANLSILSKVAEDRPYVGLLETLRRLRSLMDGSDLWQDGTARNLQDPVTFRCLPQILGATRDALAYTADHLAIELNAAQHNPLIDFERRRSVSVGSFEILPLATALDFLRIALAPALTSANERSLKLLNGTFSGLREGLAARPDLADDGYSELGVAGQGITAESRLLAQPVSFEMVSSTHAEGIEDRMTMAPLAARRLAEMAGLGARVAAIESVVAARAVDLRGGAGRLGTGTRIAYDLVRARIADTGEGDAVPHTLEPIVDLVQSGDLRPGRK